MRYLFLLISLLFLAEPNSWAQNKGSKGPDISGIKSQYLAIEAKRKSYIQYTTPTQEEGMAFIGFYEGKALKMLNCNYTQDMSLSDADHYYSGNQVILVYAKDSEFEESLKVNPRTKVKSMTENWYYFNKEILIKWVSGGKVMDSNSEAFKAKQANFTKEFAANKKRFSDQSKLVQVK
ncbi:MAG: hypothetical protein ACOVK9_08600 [Bacteroidia bacterium]